MKKNLTKIVIFIILFSLAFGTHYSSFASEAVEMIKTADSTSIMSDDFTEAFDPNTETSTAVNAISEPMTNAIVQVVNGVLGAIQVIGGILSVVAIALFGFRMIIRSNEGLYHDLGLDRRMMGLPGGDNPDALKNSIDYLRALLIGSVLLFASSTIVKFILSATFL